MRDFDAALVTIFDLELDRVCGGNGFTDWLANTLGYGGPSVASEAASAIQPVGGVMAIAPQARNRNALIRDMAQNGGNYSEANFDRYNNGKAAQLARKVGQW